MKRIALLLTFALAPVFAQGATYYVAKTGSDGNSCSQATTSATPKLTINGGLACLAGGDTLIIGGGVYAEGIGLGKIPSGTDDAHHTLVQGAPGASVKLTGQGVNFDVVEVSALRYATVDNLELVGGLDGGAGTATNFGVRVGESGAGYEAQYILLSNLIIHNAAGGIYGGANPNNNHITFRGLTVYHNGYPYGGGDHGHNIYLAGSDLVVENCNIYDSESHGIHIYTPYGYGADRITVRNNRIHDNGSFGLMFSSGRDNVAYNNLIYHNGVRNSGAGGFRFYDGAVNSQFYNNTVYNNANYGIWVQSGDGSVVRNNISYANAAGDYVDNGTSTVSGSNLFGIDPSFVNAGGGDFHLNSTSAAVDKATSMSSIFAADFDGNSRPQGNGWDVGAFEYGGSSDAFSGGTTIQVSAPQNLRLISVQ